MSFEDIIKIDIRREDIPTYHLFDKLLEIGVTQVTEKWHGMFEPELILEGDFKDEDVAICIYQHSPAMYSMKGSTVVTIQTEHGMYRTAFTRS